MFILFLYSVVLMFALVFIVFGDDLLAGACGAGRYWLVWFLLRVGVRHRWSVFNDPLLAAVRGGHVGVCGLLIDNGFDVMRKYNPSFSTIVHVSATLDDVGVMGLLVERGADVNVRDKNGRGPLHWAAVHGRLEVVKYLVGVGASVDHVDGSGWSPLLLAAVHGHLRVVEFLLECGADPFVRDGEGRSVWDFLGGRAEALFRDSVRALS